MCLFPKLMWPTRTREKLKSGEIIVSGDHWPIFLYEDYVYDDEDPWKGLLRSSLLVKVRDLTKLTLCDHVTYPECTGL